LIRIHFEIVFDIPASAYSCSISGSRWFSSLWQKYGELLAERFLLRSQTEALPGGVVRYNEIKDSCLYIAEECLFVAYLASTAPREGIRKVCVKYVN
jgi:hypothetical protein